MRQQFMKDVRTQLNTQLRRVTLDSILDLVGLQVRRPSRGIVLPMAAGFSAGLAVGVGTGLLLAPTSGAELRSKIGVQVQKLALWGSSEGVAEADGGKIIADDAAEAQRSAASGSNGRMKTQRVSKAATAP